MLGGLASDECADVGDDGEAVRAVHPVDADHVGAADVDGPTSGDQRVRGPAEEGDIDHSAAEPERSGRAAVRWRTS